MNTQEKLYKMLAEGGLRVRDTRRIHQAAMANMGQRQQRVLSELSRLRDQIQFAGIGMDAEAEDRYLELLRQKRKLEQLGQLNPVLSQMPAVPSALQKALDYGQLLLQVYGGHALAKAAQGDIQSHVHALAKYSHPLATRQATLLRRLL